MMSAYNANSPRNDDTVSVAKDNSGEYSKSSQKDKKFNFVKGNSPCTNKCGNSKWTLYHMVEESSSSGEHNDDQYNYSNLNPSGSEDNEGVSDVLNRMAMVTPRTMLFSTTNNPANRLSSPALLPSVSMKPKWKAWAWISPRSNPGKSRLRRKTRFWLTATARLK